VISVTKTTQCDSSGVKEFFTQNYIVKCLDEAGIEAAYPAYALVNSL